MSFRMKFKFKPHDAGVWFPGHMYEGLQKLQRKLNIIDCIIEVHDARIPFTGRNPLFMKHAQARPYIILLNKGDLVDQQSKDTVLQKYSNTGVEKVIYGSMKGESDGRKILSEVLETVQMSDRFHRTQNKEVNIAVIGVPNVGKSSLINLIRRRVLGKTGKATATGGVAGITKSVLERIKLSIDPLVYVYDTPGIMAPVAVDPEAVCKLALCETIKPHLIGEEYLADYFLHWMNTHNHFSYVDFFGLDGPTDNVLDFLSQVAKKKKKTVRINYFGTLETRPDFRWAALQVFRALNTGQLGQFDFDERISSGELPLSPRQQLSTQPKGVIR